MSASVFPRLAEFTCMGPPLRAQIHAPVLSRTTRHTSCRGARCHGTNAAHRCDRGPLLLLTRSPCLALTARLSLATVGPAEAGRRRLLLHVEPFDLHLALLEARTERWQL